MISIHFEKTTELPYLCQQFAIVKLDAYLLSNGAVQSKTTGYEWDINQIIVGPIYACWIVVIIGLVGGVVEST